MLTFVLVHSTVTVLLPVTPPGQRNALTAVSTLPLVFPALCWWWHAVLDTQDQISHTFSELTHKTLFVWPAKLQYESKYDKCSWSKKRLPQLFNTDLLHSDCSFFYLLIRPIFAVVLAIAEPLFLQAQVAVWASQLRWAARWSCAIHLISTVTAVSIAITSESLRHTLTTRTAVLVNCTGY